MRQVANARRPGRVHYNNHVGTVAAKGPVLLLLTGEVPDSNLGPFEWVLYSLPQSAQEDTGVSLKLEHGRFLTHTLQFTTVTVSESTFLNAESFCTMEHGTDTTWNSAIACLCDSVCKGRHVYMAFACIRALQMTPHLNKQYAVVCITVFGGKVISLEKLLQDAKYWRDYLVSKNDV